MINPIAHQHKNIRKRPANAIKAYHIRFVIGVLDTCASAPGHAPGPSSLHCDGPQLPSNNLNTKIRKEITFDCAHQILKKKQLDF